jgi:hypothetical protein
VQKLEPYDRPKRHHDKSRNLTKFFPRNLQFVLSHLHSNPHYTPYADEDVFLNNQIIPSSNSGFYDKDKSQPPAEK